MHRSSVLPPDMLEDIGSGVRAHPTALFHRSAEIGEGSVLGPFTIVEQDASIGKGCKLFPHAIVKAGAMLGDGVILGDGAHVLTYAQVGDRCVIGEHCSVYGNARLGRGVKMESCTQVWPLVTLEDDVFVGPNATFTNDLTPRAGEPKGGADNWVPTLVQRGVSIGANATIVCGTTIGRYAVIGSGAVVTKNVSPHALVTGVPARRSAWVCKRNHKQQRWTKLEFGATGRQVCPMCNAEYALFDGGAVVEIGPDALTQ